MVYRADWKSLSSLCQTNQDFRKLCEDQGLWRAVNALKGWLVDWDSGLTPKEWFFMLAKCPAPEVQRLLAMRETDTNGEESIMMNAFSGNTVLRLKRLPSSIKRIDHMAFQGCSSLALESLPPNLEMISNYVFNGCIQLALKSLPQNALRTIGEYAFSNCQNMTLSDQKGELPLLTFIGSGAFQGCTSLRLSGLPPELKAIQSYTFMECSNLALTTLPPKVLIIGRAAFSKCDALALTSLPGNLKIIQFAAFNGCNSLQLTELPCSVIKIEDDAFDNCDKFRKRPESQAFVEAVLSINPKAFG